MALLGSLSTSGQGDLGNQGQQQQRRTAGHEPAGELPREVRPARAVTPSCGGCQCFAAPAAMPEGADAAAWRAAHKHMGKCRRFPQGVDKAAEDFCFEFIAKNLTETQPHAR